jgi:hypothetical protein
VAIGIAGIGWAAVVRGGEPAGSVPAENAKESQECLDLREQVRTLTRLLEESRSREEALRGGDSRSGTSGKPGSGAIVETARVVAVDPEGRWVAVDAGTAAGVQLGLVFHVFRGDQWIARVRVEEVRERIAGAVIEHVRKGDAPVPGDRVALARDR